jgi:hypothetical protein
MRCTLFLGVGIAYPPLMLSELETNMVSQERREELLEYEGKMRKNKKIVRKGTRF